MLPNLKKIIFFTIFGLSLFTTTIAFAQEDETSDDSSYYNNYNYYSNINYQSTDNQDPTANTLNWYTDTPSTQDNYYGDPSKLNSYTNFDYNNPYIYNSNSNAEPNSNTDDFSERNGLQTVLENINPQADESEQPAWYTKGMNSLTPEDIKNIETQTVNDRIRQSYTDYSNNNYLDTGNQNVEDQNLQQNNTQPEWNLNISTWEDCKPFTYTDGDKIQNPKISNAKQYTSCLDAHANPQNQNTSSNISNYDFGFTVTEEEKNKALAGPPPAPKKETKTDANYREFNWFFNDAVPYYAKTWSNKTLEILGLKK